MLPASLDDRPIDDALRGGHAADRLGVAFRHGYRAALRALVPGVPAATSLCATEEGGAHPRAIATTLAGGRLRGRKRWSTLADDADVLLVVAKVGVDETGRNRLRVVQVAADAPGVTITPMPPPPFVPEIGHAEVALDDVAVAPEDVLPGDGYDDYLKPFRTIEDIHVHGALIGWLAGLAARHAWPRELAERIAALAVALRGLAAQPARAPETHVALAGAIALTREVVEGSPWERLDPEARARWERDRALLEVAGRARAARRDAAWARLAPDVPDVPDAP